MMRYLMLMLVLAGCATLQRGGTLQQSPVVQGGVAIGSQLACQEYAAANPEAARTTRDYLVTVQTAAGACIHGIEAGLPPTP